MKYGLTLLVIVAAVIFLFVRGLWDEKKKRAGDARKLLAAYGRRPEKKRRSVKREVAVMQGRFTIDEITWRELDMDAVFARMDYTLSSAGENYLYKALHHPARCEKEAVRWEAVAGYFAAHHQERVQVQLLLAEIGRETGPSLSAWLSMMKEEQGKSVAAEYAVNMIYVFAGLAALRDAAVGIFLFAAVAVFQIVTYFHRRAQVLPCLSGVAEMMRALRGAEKLRRILPSALWEEAEQTAGISLVDGIRKLRPLKRHCFWVLQCKSAGSHPLSLPGDYARMLFHFDLIQFRKLKHKMLSLEPELLAIYDTIGYVDSAISIAMYRASLREWSLPVLRTAAEQMPAGQSGLSMEEGYHPLIKDAVAGSIEVCGSQGVLITGSNASGKSTFLKMTALNLLLAQTIHTALAKRFSAPFSRIYTAMRAEDDIGRGESSYMAEILSLKRVLDAGRQKEPFPVFCFIDEILRGTNTVERIAASAHILRSFRPPLVYCFAATHDRELMVLTRKQYDAYYFDEEVRDGQLFFPYRLRRGIAGTGNAIRLLAEAGYDREITEGAAAQVEDFLKEGVWR